MNSTTIVDRTNARVDWALSHNRAKERVVICLAIGMFLLGAAIVFAAISSKNFVLIGGAALLQWLMSSSLKAVIRLQRDSHLLQVFPVLVSTLSPEVAAEEVVKLLGHLRSDNK